MKNMTYSVCASGTNGFINAIYSDLPSAIKKATMLAKENDYVNRAWIEDSKGREIFSVSFKDEN